MCACTGSLAAAHIIGPDANEVGKAFGVGVKKGRDREAGGRRRRG